MFPICNFIRVVRATRARFIAMSGFRRHGIVSGAGWENGKSHPCGNGEKADGFMGGSSRAP